MSETRTLIFLLLSIVGLVIFSLSLYQRIGQLFILGSTFLIVGLLSGVLNEIILLNRGYKT